MEFFETPVLENAVVRLEPLSHSHRNDLAKAVELGDLRRAWYTHVPSPETMSAEIDARLELLETRTRVPWAIIDRGTEMAVGMTSYLNLAEEHRRLEIGSTWLGGEAQGTLVNPAAKLLLLTRAFETLGCIAVEFRTHWHNHQSRAAIEKLGAKQDGVLRNHQIFENGTIRDTVVYSVIDSEWPTVKFALAERTGLG